MSGQPRFCRETSDSIANIEKEFEGCQVDWYFYLWNLSDHQPGSTSYVNVRWVHKSWRNLDNYEEIKSRLTSKLPYNHSLKGLGIGSYNDELQDPSFYANVTTVPMWISLQRADLMRRECEKNENFKYDLVIRTRPDQVVKGKLNIEIEPKHILVPHIHYFGTSLPQNINDWFAMGDSDTMTIYCDIIQNIKSYSHLFNPKPAHPETLLAGYLHQNMSKIFVSDEITVKMKNYSEIINEERLMDYGEWASDTKRKSGFVKKGWGHELIWATNDKYCGKLLAFDAGSKFSMHFHSEKDESWYVLSGKFVVRYIDTTDASQHEKELNVGDTWHNPPLIIHQVECIETGTIIEVSTPDSVQDNYRVLPGDSQKKRD